MFQTILFDIDGVMLSEERYFDASALTVLELLCSSEYLGLDFPQLPPFQTNLTEAVIRSIRSAVFADDSVLRTMKAAGVNANWDMVYLQTAFQITEILAQLKAHGVDFAPVTGLIQGGWTKFALQQLGEFIRKTDVHIEPKFASYSAVYSSETNKQDLFDNVDARLRRVLSDDVPLFRYGRSLWNLGQTCFQEWYLGDAYNPVGRHSGKRGFLTDELPLVDAIALQNLFRHLQACGIVIGVGTGRPAIETRVPLDSLGWLAFFEESRISTASDVLEAERQYPRAAPLAKPHPFAYVRSYLGEMDARNVLDFGLPLSSETGRNLLIVGDSVADLLAAKSIGCAFAAVLTGLEGEGARVQFEQLGADLILRDVLELSSYV